MIMHLFYAREAMRSFRHHSGLALTAILSLTAALTISGIVLLLAHNARVAMNLVGDRREMVAYLNDGLSAEQRDGLIHRIQDLYGTVTYVNKEQAWQEFVRQVGDAQLLESVGDNPLPSSLRIRLKTELLTPDGMEQTAQQIAQFEGVEDVRYGAEWVRRLHAAGRALERLSLGVLTLVGLAVVFILYNTIRLTVMARRQQVEIMSRLGATDRFIAIPFVLEALFQALVAGLVALAIVLAVQQAATRQLVGGIVFLPWQAVLGFLGAVLVLAWLGTSLALARVLRSVGP
jgi:cell division transport system permease protein